MPSPPTHHALDILNEVGSYALEPVTQPRTIERTNGYYVGWWGCIMHLQSLVRTHEVSTEAEFREQIENSRLAGDRMLSACAYTHEDCSEVEDLPNAALGDVALAPLVRFARGWVAAAEKVEERLTRVADHVFKDTEHP